MPKFTAPQGFRDEAVHVGAHTIDLTDGVGTSDALNAGEIAHLRGRGFTVADDAPATRKPRTSAPAADGANS